jgi:hypothetical protein
LVILDCQEIVPCVEILNPDTELMLTDALGINTYFIPDYIMNGDFDVINHKAIQLNVDILYGGIGENLHCLGHVIPLLLGRRVIGNLPLSQGNSYQEDEGYYGQESMHVL